MAAESPHPDRAAKSPPQPSINLNASSALNASAAALLCHTHTHKCTHIACTYLPHLHARLMLQTRVSASAHVHLCDYSRVIALLRDVALCRRRGVRITSTTHRHSRMPVKYHSRHKNHTRRRLRHAIASPDDCGLCYAASSIEHRQRGL